MNFKIKVKGEMAPLKFKLEYYDTSDKKNMSQKSLVGLKGFLEIFFSKTTDTPSQVQLQIDDMQNNCEKYYNQPPQFVTL